MGKPTQSVRVSGPRATKGAVTAAKRQRAKRSGPKRSWQPAFLLALAETSNVTAAANAAGVQPSYPYKVKRDDNAFAKAWREALCEGYDNLELELLHRLRFGEAKDADAKFDNANALRLLTQHRETVARQRAIRGNEDVAQVRASIHAKLLQLREQVLARRKAEQESADASHG
ncbi:hypothetical protein IP81_17010 [Novosphingobium sp. AAP83]|uniref:hypothetical protein n=1 Tax=Novosphingobium sp. AAP83 TaxID=1523425 RepID=UPI0006B9A910|nr:hypothetical protein [Novosphingobium sp. AAP83]KPF89309.1 hypothetical protein IP81_17010 [Novosphingobium sp. AAP83]